MAKKRVRLTSDNIAKLANHLKRSSQETLDEKSLDKMLNSVASDLEAYLINQT